MNDSITQVQLKNIFDKVFSFDVMEKNSGYHGILEIINSNDPKDAAKYILETIEEMLYNKALLAEEVVSMTMDGEFMGASGKKGIFRRVG